ncbi:MAG: DUF2203 domain-containing protein [Verrucomicrobiae bacterium]|nr:DUF2203 domain-containing protein [Verrucomicrobiae bacterium]MDW8308264.1 DUF2203 domain-containing protein [Verrucomicrobiales bacterium]
MGYRFNKHYTVEEARALLPQVRTWLERLQQLREEVERAERKLASLTGAGQDVGGELVHRWVRGLVAAHETFREFRQREIQIKDLDRGLVDFPSLRDGREVFLCWEQGEPDIEFWHDLDAGYAGREPLE